MQHRHTTASTGRREEHPPPSYCKRLQESWCQTSGSSYSQCPGGVLDNCVIWICQAASSSSQGLLMMFPYIQYSLHLYRETALSTQRLDSLLVGSMRFSRGCFPAAIVWWCMGRCLGSVHLSHCALFSCVMWRRELGQIFTLDVSCYNASVKGEDVHGNKFGAGCRIVMDFDPATRMEIMCIENAIHLFIIFEAKVFLSFLFSDPHFISFIIQIVQQRLYHSHWHMNCSCSLFYSKLIRLNKPCIKVDKS